MLKSIPEPIHEVQARVKLAVEKVRSLAANRNPQLALILGSGLGSFANKLENAVSISYTEIPGFPVSNVAGHAGRLVFGTCSGKEVLVMQGRGHLYEGYSFQQLIFPIRVMSALGVKTLIVTNAAGSVNTELEVGSLMLLNDHINFSQLNPLIGPNDNSIGSRFPDNSRVYDESIRAKAKHIANELGWHLPEGSYMFMTGPTYETPAEIRMARVLGADAVGMSTFPEALAAFHAGIKVCGISYITNAGAGMRDEKLDHKKILHMSDAAISRFIQLLNKLIEQI